MSQQRRINDEPETILKLFSVFFMVQKIYDDLVYSYQTGNSAWRVV